MLHSSLVAVPRRCRAHGLAVCRVVVGGGLVLGLLASSGRVWAQPEREEEIEVRVRDELQPPASGRDPTAG